MQNKEKGNRILRTLASLLLVIGLLLGQFPGMYTLAKADGWTDWASLFAQSGWYDSNQADETQDQQQKQTEKQSKKKQKNKNSKQQQQSGSNSSKKNSSPSVKSETSAEKEEENASLAVEEDGCYTSKEEVAAYIHEFGHLPDNFITKNEAKKLGWVSSEGNLEKVAPGKSIGGDHFGNYEGALPEKKGRSYYECDIDFDGGYRDAKRIIFSDDGLIYYTEDHYTTFDLLYGEE